MSKNRETEVPAVETQGLRKCYGSTTALYDLTLTIGTGELFGFIGPDGAGKTSLFRMLATLLLPDSGQARVCGLDVVKDYRALRRILGYMPGRFSLYQDLTVEENLRFFATIYNTSIERNYSLIRDIYGQLEPFKTRRAGKLSGGMKQKLALSCALIHKPGILLLDEPTTGVDAVSRREFWEMLARLKEHGITIVVSTPYMDEAGKCDRVALIQSGLVLKVDSPAGIVASFSRRLLAVKTQDTYGAIKALRAYPFVNSVYGFGAEIHYTDTRPDFQKNDIESHLAQQGIRAAHTRFIEAGIEDAFIAEMENSNA